MAHDETDFDKLLREAREWDARDRARHKSSAMTDGGAAEPFPAASRGPTVSIGELEKKTAMDLGPKREATPKAERPKVEMLRAETPKPVAAIKTAFETVMKQAQAQRAADRAKAADRARRKGGWGWIWLLIALYFVFKHFVR
jgi:predicted Zn-dependent protease